MQNYRETPGKIPFLESLVGVATPGSLGPTPGWARKGARTERLLSHNGPSDEEKFVCNAGNYESTPTKRGARPDQGSVAPGCSAAARMDDPVAHSSP